MLLLFMLPALTLNLMTSLPWAEIWFLKLFSVHCFAGI